MQASGELPPTLFGYIWRASGRHQLALCAMSIAVFLLSTVPLELQRRIVNDAIANGSRSAIFALALAYAGFALLEGGIKLGLNIYRAWVSERAVLQLRRRIGALTGNAVAAEDRAMAEGVEISMILSEAEPIGGFAGISFSEPLLQGGLLLSVFAYLTWLEPWMALLSVTVFSPQLVFVPLLQRAINRRAADRIKTLREVSGEIVGASAANSAAQNGHLDHVFVLNMGIYKLKFSMNFLMNLMHHLGVATALGVGGLLAVQGRLEVGTVVAFISGLAKVNDPWGDVVNWFREMTVVAMRYRMVAEAMRWLERINGKA
jgi:ABC-type multidrug transport system fused ATPase/permease subunit